MTKPVVSRSRAGRLMLVLLAVLLAGALLPVVPIQAQSGPSLVLSGKFSVAYDGYDTMPVLVGLVDASGLFGKDPNYLPPKGQQYLGKVSGVASKGNYTLTLPSNPTARPFDSTGAGTPSQDLFIFDVRLMSDVANRGVMIPNEDVIASSLGITIDVFVESGTLVVWAGNDKQQFPTEPGADGKLFTADDPRTTLTAGWSLVDLSTKPYKISRQAPLELDLITTGAADESDFRSLSCDVLIPTFLDRVEKVYPFTDLNKIDWAALRAKLIPASKTAQTPADCERIIRDFGNAIPDGHVNFGLPALRDEYAGSLGLSLNPTTDGKVVVTAIRPDSPADKAGIKRGAVLTQWDGKPIDEALRNVVLQSANASTPHALLNIRLSLLQRGKLGSTAQVTFQNPGAQPTTATITRVEPQRITLPGTTLNAKDNKLPSGIGYIRINAFSNGALLGSFDKIVDQLVKENVPGIIIDVRSNPGGFSQLSDAMASRFFDQAFVIGRQFSPDGRLVYQMRVDPREPTYKGLVAILVDVNTSSAGDLFAYTFKLGKRALIVGNTPSGGLAGTVSGGQYYLPGGAFIQVPTGGFVDENGKIAVEGTGVVPDLLVPATVESLLSPDDEVLIGAEQALLQGKKP